MKSKDFIKEQNVENEINYIEYMNLLPSFVNNPKEEHNKKHTSIEVSSLQTLSELILKRILKRIENKKKEKYDELLQDLK